VTVRSSWSANALVNAQSVARVTLLPGACEGRRADADAGAQRLLRTARFGVGASRRRAGAPREGGHGARRRGPADPFTEPSAANAAGRAPDQVRPRSISPQAAVVGSRGAGARL